jgi:hypothetical protein
MKNILSYNLVCGSNYKEWQTKQRKHNEVILAIRPGFESFLNAVVVGEYQLVYSNVEIKNILKNEAVLNRIRTKESRVVITLLFSLFNK